MKVTAIFDIGKTNKKFFLFDARFKEVYRAYSRFEEVCDEDGFPCENLEALSAWMLETFRDAQAMPAFDIERLNFSTYGASFVHLNAAGQPVAPLYNYLKPCPEDLLEDFFQQYDPQENWAVQTASPQMGMLNSGLQLYWLKHRKPAIFSQIYQSLHLPQYCAFLFTGKYQSDYTSIGCHTGLWNFQQNDYHEWVYREKLDQLLPPVLPTTSSIETIIGGKPVKVGTGIHDSSAALLPYILETKDPFLLLSTGTWNIALNPFSQQILSAEDLRQDCLNFLRVDGLPVRAARVFIGNEYKVWSHKLADHFQQPYEKHRAIQPDAAVLKQLERLKSPVFHWESIRFPGAEKCLAGNTDLQLFTSYEEAYHQLIKELVDLQVVSLNLAKGTTPVRKIYVDGGFIDNELFLQLLAARLPDVALVPTEAPLGTALGAAIAVRNGGGNPESFFHSVPVSQPDHLRP